VLTNALSRLTSLGLPIAHVCRFLQDKLIRAPEPIGVAPRVANLSREAGSAIAGAN